MLNVRFSDISRKLLRTRGLSYMCQTIGQTRRFTLIFGRHFFLAILANESCASWARFLLWK